MSQKTTSFSKVQGVTDTEGGTAKGQNSDQKQLVCLCVHAHIHKAAHAHVCICLCIYIFLSSGYFFFFSFVSLFPQFAIHLISTLFSFLFFYSVPFSFLYLSFSLSLPLLPFLLCFSFSPSFPTSPNIFSLLSQSTSLPAPPHLHLILFPLCL